MGVCSSTPSDRSQLAAAEKQAQQLRSLLTAADARIHQLQGLLAANGVPHGMQAQSKVPALMHQSSDIAAARDSHAMANAGLLTHHAVNLNMQQPSAQQQQRSYQQAYMQPAPQPQPQPMPQPAPVYQPPPPASSNVHKRAVSTASVYDDQDLDDEWAALLNDVDAILMEKEKDPMRPTERAVAIRTLVAATATRGVQFALTAAVDEIVRHRGWTAKRQQQQA